MRELLITETSNTLALLQARYLEISLNNSRKYPKSLYEGYFTIGFDQRN